VRGTESTLSSTECGALMLTREDLASCRSVEEIALGEYRFDVEY
jgi:hypothetical protein